MKKNISILLTTVFLAASLSACSQTSASEAETSGAEAPSAAAENSTAAENEENTAGSSETSAAASNAAQTGEPYRVSIVQPMSHTSLDQIRDTIIASLEASGKNIEITTENANNDTSALATILNNVRSQGTDLVIPIATSTAQSATV